MKEIWNMSYFTLSLLSYEISGEAESLTGPTQRKHYWLSLHEANLKWCVPGQRGRTNQLDFKFCDLHLLFRCRLPVFN